MFLDEIHRKNIRKEEMYNITLYSYINKYTIGKHPHNGKHNNCGYCQLETIEKIYIRKKKKCIISHSI